MQGSSANVATREQIWQIVAAVPAGRVATYGQVAALAGLPRRARYAGTTLKQLPAGTALPWHRIINAAGRISFPEGSDKYREQRRRLEAEGVGFNANGRIELRRHQWAP